MVLENVERVGWFGADQINHCDISAHFILHHSDYTSGTAKLIQLYGDHGSVERQFLEPLHKKVGSEGLVAKHANNVVGTALHDDVEAKTGFTIITLFYRHYDYFKECAQSVSALFKRSQSENIEDFEWIVVNDDPSFTSEAILDAIPRDIHRFVKLSSDGKNAGISKRTNQACLVAEYENLIFLDCDDKIVDSTLLVLRHYFERFPCVRYISSNCVDVDQDGQVLRQRIHFHPSTEMYARGMLAGHLKCIKRSLYDDLAGFSSEFSGVQDYDFALRTLLQEKILLIPEALYEYRWHKNTQSLSRELRQASGAERVRKNALRQLISWQVQPYSADWNADDKGICIIRTIGKDLGLLEEAIESVLLNNMVACVVSHTDHSVFEFIKGKFCKSNIIVLHAHDVSKKRGYPINVALDYIADNAEQYGFFCLLDDDDYLLPNFANDLLRSAMDTRADVVYGLSNSVDTNGRRHCQHAPCPSIALLGGNFITVGSYIVNLRSFLKTGIRFSEDIHYLEDWEFLIRLLENGMTFMPYFKAVSEYRMIGDGNTDSRNRPEEYVFCSQIVMATAARASLSFDIMDFWRDVCTYPDKETYRLSGGALGALDCAKKMLMQRAEFSL